jgi:hypothetical protein
MILFNTAWLGACGCSLKLFSGHGNDLLSQACRDRSLVLS